MWNDFSDFELAELAFNYGLQVYVNFDITPTGFKLSKREELECIIAEHEYALAYDEKQEVLDFYSEVE